jgi:hypothetical protein
MKEYNLIREALMALMCVGDEINHLYYCHGGYNTILRCRILEITDYKVVIEDWGSCNLSSIEHYQGELYIWEEKYYFNREAKVERMIELIEGYRER